MAIECMMIFTKIANGKIFNGNVNGASNILCKSKVVSLWTLYGRGEAEESVRIRVA